MNAKLAFLTIHIAVSMILLVLTTGNLRAEDTIPPQQCLIDAWKAFNEKRYEDAITFADKCISDFARTAANKQAKLESEGIEPPPTGSVTEPEKKRIFKQELLNDVATAYFIKGRSAEHLYKAGGANSAGYKGQAEQAYKETCKYKYGRTWDPKGWFWSPCDAASERLPLD